jgi:competence protein ComEC
MFNHAKKHIFLFIITVFSFLAINVPYSVSSTIQTNEEITIHFIDVGQGDCIFIVLPSGENILVDVGSPSEGPKAVWYLKTIGVKRIDHLILTHPDEDHIGGIFSILPEFKVLSFYDSGFSNFKSNIYGDYVKLIREDLSKYNILQAGETFHFGNIKIEVLNPLLPPTGNSNADSIVLRLIYGNIKILLAGDLEKLGERRLISLGTELRSQILKVGHHGDNDASSDDFLRSVKPEIAIVSVGKINRYARPHQEVLDRLTQIGSKIFRTDINGNIVIKIDGKSYSIKTEK